MFRKLLNSVHILFTLALVGVVIYFHFRGPVKEVVVKTEKVTVTDTVTVTEVEEHWQEITNTVYDTIIVTRPDTVLVTEEAPLWPVEWLIYRLHYAPPQLEYSIVQASDTTQTLHHYQYSDIPWGFTISPTKTGPPEVTGLVRPDPPPFSRGYRWGLGFSWAREGISPAGFVEYYLRWKEWALTGRSSITLRGVVANIYLTW